MDKVTLAYLAGAMDSDGWFGIKKYTYAKRVLNKAWNASYTERCGLKQVTPEIPSLLHEVFGGYVYLHRPQTPNSKRLYGWECRGPRAAGVCKTLLPFIRVKRSQVETVLALTQTRAPEQKNAAFWFLREFPRWQNMELITCSETATTLGYHSLTSVTQAIKSGNLLAVPYDHSGTGKPRIPKLLVERLAQQVGIDGKLRVHAPQVVALRESLFRQIKTLNKIGVNGTPIFHGTGHYRPKS